MSHRPSHMLASLILAAAAAGALAGSGTDPRSYDAFYAPAYRLPDSSRMTDSAARGKDLFHATYRYLGAGSGVVADNGKPYVGNALACANCHMDDGTRPFAVPLVVASLEYANPQFSPRENVARDLPIRINGCFERSLAGEMLPTDSAWMKDLVAYLDFLSTGLQPGYTWQQVPGQETRKPPALARAADPVRGAAIYRDQCRSCHQDDGGGVWRDDEERFRYPALWGPDSHGLMAGMGRLQTAAAFVYSNMPFDKVDAIDAGTLMSPEDAWDVAAYLLSQDRPFNDRHIDGDWAGVGPDGVPNALKRAVDASYDHTMPRVTPAGEWSIDPNDPPAFAREQHIYGPFRPISDALKSTRDWLGY